MTNIIENAIHSLQLGIEDFKSNDTRRPISAARNYYAGLLLLAKQCLIESAPHADPMDVIGAKYKPVPDGQGSVAHKADGYKTVDLSQLQSRFKDFNLAWPKANIDRLQALRNDLEHLHPKEPLQSVKEAIAQSFPMVEAFFKLLRRDPATELGDAWQSMLEERAFFDGQKKACNASFEKVDWLAEITAHEDFACPFCHSSLIEQLDPSNTVPQEIMGKCRACGIEMGAEQVVQIALGAEYGDDAYIAAKDGGDEVICDCPECGLNTYIMTYDVNGCFWCEYVLKGDCARCHIALTPSNVAYDNNGLCSYCDDLFKKDD